ncbi:MAG: dihydrodipicolinate synthase family protein [Chloroflexi bacterium]|nr:dihydrodipicolinate synthase family protein [Chloroflexota bacterium]
MTTQLPHGLWPVMLTPFQDDGALDLPGLDALVDWYLDAGSAGLFTVAASSEMYEMRDEERLIVARRVVQRSNGRAPVVASATFGGDLESQADFVKRMAETGVAAVVILPCQLVAPDEDDATLQRQIERLLALTDPLPLGVYECPRPYHRLFTPELLAWAAQSGRFLYFKDTCRDIVSIRAKQAAINGTPLRLYNAHTQSALASLQAGAAGISPIAGNYYAALYAWLCEHYADQPALAAELQAGLTEMERIASNKYPAAAKLYLARSGVPITSFCRVPVAPITEADVAQLEALGEKVQGWVGKLQIANCKSANHE